jgi:hypothetical protein
VLHFSIDQDEVITSATTDFQKGPCKDLSKHDQVTVSGTRSFGGIILATTVTFEKK